MGYRTYIGKISKTKYNEINNLSIEELNKHFNIDEDDWLGMYDIVDNLYELGKYVDEFEKDLYKPFFLNSATQSRYTEEHDCFKVDKQFLELLIKHYADKVRTYYMSLLNDFVDPNDKLLRFINLNDIEFNDIYKTSIANILNHIRDMAFEWGCVVDRMLPYDLNHGDEVSTSWKYEYAQFELVRIYKTFDWDNDILVYYGY